MPQLRLRSASPAIDYHYLGTGGKFGTRAPRLKPASPSFYKLGNDFIGSENKRHYLQEAAFFAIIVAISTWPIVSMVRAVAELVK